MDNLTAVKHSDPTSTLTRPSTVVDVLLGRAAADGPRPVFTYLANGEEEVLTHSFADLDRQARSIAALLARRGCCPGDRALLLYPPSEPEFIRAFLGCLYAGVVAVPVPPPPPLAARGSRTDPAAAATRLRRALAKILAITADSRPAVIMTTEPLRAALEAAREDFDRAGTTTWLATDGPEEAAASEWVRPPIDESSLAFLQYTSGSTAAPKGVMVTHGNLILNAEYIESAWGHGREDVLVSWLPTFHDLGLIYGTLQPIYSGFRCYVMPPAAFIQRPVRWLHALSRYGGTHSAAPNFAYDLCLRKTTEEDRAALDLSRWISAVNGAEPVRALTLAAFTETFGPCGFRRATHRPAYGLAEATLLVSGARASAGEEYVSLEVSASALERHRVVFKSETGDGDGAPDSDTRTLVACGRAASELRVRIVNPQTRELCAPDEVGEIWVAGENVASGYWQLPDVSEATFRARLAGGADGDTYLRTGDLGFLADGQLVITGRYKDMIIVGGANHYPQDIELTAERSHPALRPGCGAAFAVEADEAERVVVAIEVDPARGGEGARLTAQELTAAVRRAVAEEHEIQVYRVVLLKAGSVPKTSSGKIQRRACRDLFFSGGLDLWEEEVGGR